MPGPIARNFLTVSGASADARQALNELATALRGGINPLGMDGQQYGASADAAGRPSLGTPSFPWGQIHGTELIIGGSVLPVAGLADAAIYTPHFFAASGSLTWPYGQLTRALAILISGKGRDDSGQVLIQEGDTFNPTRRLNYINYGGQSMTLALIGPLASGDVLTVTVGADSTTGPGGASAVARGADTLATSGSGPAGGTAAALVSSRAAIATAPSATLIPARA